MTAAHDKQQEWLTPDKATPIPRIHRLSTRPTAPAAKIALNFSRVGSGTNDMMSMKRTALIAGPK